MEITNYKEVVKLLDDLTEKGYKHLYGYDVYDVKVDVSNYFLNENNTKLYIETNDDDLTYSFYTKKEN